MEKSSPLPPSKSESYEGRQGMKMEFVVKFLGPRSGYFRFVLCTGRKSRFVILPCVLTRCCVLYYLLVFVIQQKIVHFSRFFFLIARTFFFFAVFAVFAVSFSTKKKSAKNLGDEGGYAPPLKNADEALTCIEGAVKSAGYEIGQDGKRERENVVWKMESLNSTTLFFFFFA